VTIAQHSRIALLVLTVAAASPQTAAAQGSGLRFFKSYFVTGGHVAAGVTLRNTGVNGIAAGDIEIRAGAGGVPFRDLNANGRYDAGDQAADVIAAFLYWETVTSSTGNGAAGARFNHQDISLIAKDLYPAGTPACWSNAGATGGGSGARRTKIYRADVLPFLAVDGNGKRTAAGLHHVELPDAGIGNVVPSTAGATLVVVYRSPEANAPLTATVLYDGGFAQNDANRNLTLGLAGWYQSAAAATAAPALMTQIVGNGQPNFTKSLTVTDSSDRVVLAVSNPFVGPYWDTYTVPVPLAGSTSGVTVTVEATAATGPVDCLSWGAIVLSTPVQDGDRDGIVDALETQGTSGTIFDPAGQRLPDLYAMGARPGMKDIFIELAFMRSTSGYTTPLQVVPAGHSHLPAREALEMVARAFRFAPEPINVHFDIGNNYQGGALPGNNRNNCPTASAAQWTPACAIIPAALADGGEFIEETPCAPGPGSSCLFTSYPPPLPCSLQVACQFPDYPGTVGWKSGYRYYRDEPLDRRKTKIVTVDGQPMAVDAGADERACFLAETDVNADGTPKLSTSCHRRLARNRKDLFHWALWAHATGLPKSDDPASPLFHAPKNMSGLADVNGSDLMVTLGLWDRAVGTPFIQASTFMHELGHNLGRRHGGDPDQPNCKPNYQSVMNYLFQVRGLITASGAAEIGYSRQRLPALDESALNERAGLGTMQWRTRWYAPWSDSFIDTGLNITPAAKRCNGSSIGPEIMARVDGSRIGGGIDWNANGSLTSLPLPAQDLNFSGTFGTLTRGSNDWNSINLQQIGTRRNVGGWSVDSGYWDAGYWDAGVSDPGYWDAGYWDAGYWDAGYWDAGYWDAGYWDAGIDNDDTTPIGELDFDVAAAVGNAPNALTASPSGRNMVISWQPPFVASDKVVTYETYRIEGTEVTPANFAARVRIGGPNYSTATSVVDTNVKSNVTYIYIVLAQFTDGVRSGVVISQPVKK
jgi:hypothetical protein